MSAFKIGKKMDVLKKLIIYEIIYDVIITSIKYISSFIIMGN